MADWDQFKKAGGNEWDQFSKADDPPPSISGTVDKYLSRLGYGAREPLWAAAQGLRNMEPAAIRGPLDRVDAALYDVTGGTLGHRGGNLNADLQQREKEYQATQAPEGMDWTRLAGNVLGGAPLMAASLPRTFAGAALAGGMSGVTQPVYDQAKADDPMAYAREKGWQGVAGAATGGLLHGAGRVIFRPGLQPQRGLDELQAAGVQPTVGQAFGGFLGDLEQKLSSAWFLGDAIRASRRNARDQFNAATINRAVEPIQGQVLGLGHDGVREAHNLVDDAYDTARGLTPLFRPDHIAAAQAISPIVDTLNDAAQKDLSRALGATIGRFGREELDGETYKMLDSDLARLASDYKGSGGAQEKVMGRALEAFREELKNQVRALSPQSRAAFDAADAAHARMVRVDRAANSAGLKDGVFTPGQLVNAVKAEDQSVRRNRFAEGDSLMQDWAQTGQRILGDTYPDSGTPGRLLGGAGMLGGIASIDPTGLAAVLAGSAGAHPAVQQAIIRWLSSTGAANPLARGLPYASGGIDREFNRKRPGLLDLGRYAGGLLGQ